MGDYRQILQCSAGKDAAQRSVGDNRLIWVRRAWPDDPDVMVGKSVMAAGELVLGHVAANAAAGAHRAGRAWVVYIRLCSLQYVTGQAPGSEEADLCFQGAVWIMARKTTDSCVRRAPTAAVLKAVGLKPHVANPRHPHQFNLGPASMAGTTEVVQPACAEVAGVENGSLPLANFPRLHCCNMVRARAVASLAMNARHRLHGLELPACYRPGGMAHDAGPYSVFIHPHAQGIFKTRGLAAGRPHRQIQALDVIKEAHPALVVGAFPAEDVSLARGAFAEGPDNGRGNGLATVADRVDSLCPPAKNQITVGTLTESQSWMGQQDLGFGRF